MAPQAFLQHYVGLDIFAESKDTSQVCGEIHRASFKGQTSKTTLNSIYNAFSFHDQKCILVKENSVENNSGISGFDLLINTDFS